MIYPVGSIYMTATLNTAAKVKAALGGVGTWVAWGAGRVPVGVNASDSSFSTVEKTGGEKTHTLTIDEMPAHRHTIRGLPYGGTYEWQDPYVRIAYQTTSDNPYPGTGGNAINETGGSGAHNNLQPYITCYMYKRTA